MALRNTTSPFKKQTHTSTQRPFFVQDGEGLWLQTSIVVQLDRHLQQAADQTRTASCHLPAKDSSSSVLLQPLQQHRYGNAAVVCGPRLEHLP